MKTSSSERYLKGKLHPIAGKPIESVKVDGNLRIIRLKGGERVVTNKQGINNVIDTVMSAEQKAAMSKTMRTRPDGTVSVKVGGLEKGERKVYANKAAARSALSRIYGK